jgi:hypothetical protein
MTARKQCGQLRIVLPAFVCNLVAALLAGHFWRPCKILYGCTMLAAICSFFATFLFDKGIGRFREFVSIGMGLLTFGLFGMVIAELYHYAEYPVNQKGVASSFFASSLGIVWTFIFWGLVLLRPRKME